MHNQNSSAAIEQNCLLAAALSTDEGNKLIIEFLGYRLASCRNGQAWVSPHQRAIDDVYHLHGRLLSDSYYTMKFHSSWDWLMSVVKHFSYLGIAGGVTYALREALLAGEIEPAYNEVVKICQWYLNRKVASK